MRIAYWTTDEVNLDLARKWAEECGASLMLVFCKDHEDPQAGDAVLYDLDYLPANRRRDLLASFAMSPLALPMAVHSYNLDDGLVKALQNRGVAVRRRLEKELIQDLRRAVHAQGESEKTFSRGDKKPQEIEAPLTPVFSA